MEYTAYNRHFVMSCFHKITIILYESKCQTLSSENIFQNISEIEWKIRRNYCHHFRVPIALRIPALSGVITHHSHYYLAFISDFFSLWANRWSSKRFYYNSQHFLHPGYVPTFKKKPWSAYKSPSNSKLSSSTSREKAA